MAGTQVTSPNQVTRYERKNIWQIIGFISVLILIFAYKLGIDSIEYIPFYTLNIGASREEILRVKLCQRTEARLEAPVSEARKFQQT